jgi:hypothetical protein
VLTLAQQTPDGQSSGVVQWAVQSPGPHEVPQETLGGGIRWAQHTCPEEHDRPMPHEIVSPPELELELETPPELLELAAPPELLDEGPPLEPLEAGPPLELLELLPLGPPLDPPLELALESVCELPSGPPLLDVRASSLAEASCVKSPAVP